MTKLNQILAVERRVKTATNEAVTSLYHTIQRSEPLKGLSRTYQPLNDENPEVLPNEFVRPQLNAEDALNRAVSAFERLLDITATKDYTNTNARADVTLDDGTVLLADAPTTYLLFLEKQLIDVETLIKKLPMLDPANTWTWDGDLNTWRSEPVVTVRTKKALRVLVKYPATDKHPAQVETYPEDVQVGTWTTVKYSGAVPEQTVRTLLNRVQDVQRAVKFAREKANMIDVQDVHAGKSILSYILHGNA